MLEKNTHTVGKIKLSAIAFSTRTRTISPGKKRTISLEFLIVVIVIAFANIVQCKRTIKLDIEFKGNLITIITAVYN